MVVYGPVSWPSIDDMTKEVSLWLEHLKVKGQESQGLEASKYIIYVVKRKDYGDKHVRAKCASSAKALMAHHCF